MSLEEHVRSALDSLLVNATRNGGKTIRDLQGVVETVEDKLLGVRDSIAAAFGLKAENPELPQDSHDPEARTRQLEKAREEWRYQSPAFLPPLSNVDGKPPGQELSGAYMEQLLPLILNIALNQIESCREFFKDNPEAHPDLSALPDYLREASSSLGPTTLLKNMMQSLLDGKMVRARRLEMFDRFFHTLPRPSMATAYQHDELFAYQRIGGGNNTIIERIDSVPDKLPITDETFRRVVGDDEATLEAAGKEGRLYLCDYRILDGIPAGETFGVPKYLAAPVALFYWQPGGIGGGTLRPVAIQLGQRPDPDKTPVFTPLDGVKWTIAKAFVQNADGVQLQTIAHLQHCHLTVEPLMLPTMRHLASNHPVNVLLKPHFLFTVPINYESRTSLITPGGVVDSILSPELETGTYEIVKRAFAEWRFDAALPEATFKARGVDDASVMPSFPFRDDTLLIWRAIEKYVASYLEVYYPSDESVARDTELQAWMREIRSPEGPNLPGLETFLDATGQLATRSALGKILAYIIYLAGPQHSSVNYSMYPYEGYIPACPLSLWGPPPTAHDAEDEVSYVLRLPPMDISLYQSHFSYLLAMQRFDTFGQHHHGIFTDPRVAPAIAALQGDLKNIEQTIVERNNSRQFPYELQLPSRITNSISI